VRCVPSLQLHLTIYNCLHDLRSLLY
jgi:hypothetical protein